MVPVFQKREEVIALALFYVNAIGTEVLIDPADPLDCPEDVRGWVNVEDAAGRFGITAVSVLDGFRRHAERGVLAVAQDIAEPRRLYVELRRDAALESGYERWAYSYAVARLLEAKSEV